MNLFLVPATQENVKVTIQQRVDLRSAAPFLTEDQYSTLEKSLGDSSSFNCWAMTESNRSNFKLMEAGDIVLLSIKGTGMFNYAARVIHKLENERLGKALWSFVPSESWKLIYILGDVSEISVNKEALVTAMGYQPTFRVFGATRVTKPHIDVISSHYGSVKGFLVSFGINVNDGGPDSLGLSELEKQIRVGAGFGDPETNRKIEKAAISHATRWYQTNGWTVKSVESLKCGYDLFCTRGEEVEHVEVKGVSGSLVSFLITSGEVRQANTNGKFFIFVVTLALSESPEVYRYSGDVFVNQFELNPIAYRAILKSEI